MQLSEDPAEPARDDESAEAARSSGPSAGGIAADLLMCLRFYSRLPTGRSAFEAPDLDRMAYALPFASIIIGLGPAVLLVFLGALGLPGMVAAVLAVAASVLATGAMAEDAIADAADGLAGGQSVERRLEIMKDSRHGTYGVAALCLYLVFRVVALGTVAASSPLAAAGLWLAATVLGRSGALWLSYALPNARRNGVSAAAGRVSLRAFGIGIGFAVLLAIIVAAPFVTVLAIVPAVLFAAAIVWGWTATSKRLVGGQTGDLIGGLQALIDIGVLAVLLIFA